MALFGAQLCGKRHFYMLLRYFSLMCSKHTALEMPCRTSKMTISLQPELVLAGPNTDIPVFLLYLAMILIIATAFLWPPVLPHGVHA